MRIDFSLKIFDWIAAAELNVDQNQKPSACTMCHSVICYKERERAGKALAVRSCLSSTGALGFRHMSLPS